MTINELRAKRNQAWEATKAFLESRANDKGILSAEDDATYSRMEKEIEDYGKEIQRLERQQQIEAELSKATSNPIVNTPAGTVPEKTGRASDAYKQDFGLLLRGKPMLHNVLSTDVDANGGYLVPTEFEKTIVEALQEENVMRKLCKVIKTESERKIPVAAAHTVAKWTAENAAFTESNPTFDQKTIDAYKLTDLIKVSTELLEDSMFDLEDYIAKEFAYAFGVAEEQAFCVGTGTGQPTGLFTKNGGEVGVTAGSATAITADEIINLIYSLKAPYRKNAKFLMHDSTVSALRKLKDLNGQYLWQPSVQAGQPDRLLGYEIYTSPYVPTLAAGAYAIAFGDFHNYWIADRTGRTMQRLNELYSTNGQVGFVGTERVDGKIILPEGIKLLQMKASA